MGVDYSYQMGYGSRIPVEVLEDWAKGLGHDYYHDAIWELETPEGLSAHIVGNHMDGETEVVVVLDRLYSDNEHYDPPNIKFFNEQDVSIEEKMSIAQFILDTWDVMVSPGFFAGGSVS